MVKIARKATNPSALRSLNAPCLIYVQMDRYGAPVAAKFKGQWAKIVLIGDSWRIKDEWWREQSISRTYFKVLLVEGQHLTIFQDRNAGDWYEQRYD